MGLKNDKILCKTFIDDLVNLIDHKINTKKNKFNCILDMEKVFRRKYQRKINK